MTLTPADHLVPDPTQQPIIRAAFNVGRLAAGRLTHLVPGIDADRIEYAVADLAIREFERVRGMSERY